jgi:hypothetical protein
MVRSWADALACSPDETVRAASPAAERAWLMRARTWPAADPEDAEVADGELPGGVVAEADAAAEDGAEDADAEDADADASGAAVRPDAARLDAEGEGEGDPEAPDRVA